MRLINGLAAVLALSVSGCSMAKPAPCFTTRHVVLPDENRVMGRLSGGQSGRELVAAIWKGDVADATRRLRADPRLATVAVQPDPELYSQPDGQYGDLLTFAVARCDKAMVEALLDAGVPANGAEPGSALTLALLSDDPELPELLLSRGASPNPQKLQGGHDVFGSVAAANHVGGVAMLLRHGLDVKYADRFGRSYLDDAIAMNAYAIAEMLAKAGADLRHADRDGFTPAHGLAKPPVKAISAEDSAARERLIARAKADGQPWPPPPPGRR